MNNLKVCFALGVFMLLSSGASQAVAKNIPVKTITTFLQVLATVGPLEFLSGAKVTLRNAKGKVLGQRKTNIRGSAIFYLSESELSNLPFNVITSGGKIIGQTGDQLKGPAFGGHLKGEISDVSLNKHSFIYLDLLSTTAYAMRTADTSYAQATQRVRDALNIGDGFPPNGLRFKNNHTDWPLQLAAMKKNHGHDAYVRKLASRINRGNKIKELTPSRYQGVARSKTSPRIAQATASSTSTFPQCNVAVGNGSATTSSSSASTELIENFGVLSMDALLTFVGQPELIPSADAAVGMLLAGGDPGSSGQNATTTQLASVDTMLNCISSQNIYLSEQIDEVELALKVGEASTCAGDIQTDFNYYAGIVAQAQPGVPPVINPVTMLPEVSALNNQNPNLMQFVNPNVAPNWLTNYGCEAIIDNMLFSAGGGGGVLSGWAQLNYNAQQQNAWYTQLQVQQLQTFLAYWGTLMYQEWVVNSEYYNFNSETGNEQTQAGNNVGTTTCKSSTGNTMCNYRNNIESAYPGSLYSDEIGIWQSGMAVSAFPAGLAMTGLTQLTFNANWVLGQVNTSSQNQSNPAQQLNMGTLAVAPSYSYFNAQEIDPCVTDVALDSGCVGLPTGLEQFSYPQAFKTLQPTSTQIAALANPGPGGQTAQSFFFNAINYQLPPVTFTATVYKCPQEQVMCGIGPNTGTPTSETADLPWPIASQWLPANLTASAIGYAAFFASDSMLNFLWCSTSGSATCLSLSEQYPPLDGNYTPNLESIYTTPATGVSYANTQYSIGGIYGHPSYDTTNPWPSAYNSVFGALLARTYWANASCSITSPTSLSCP